MLRYHKAIALGLVVGALGVALRPTRLGLQLEEDVGLRWLFTVRGPLEPPSDVVVVTLDKGSAQQVGLDTRDWPPPRQVHARVIRELAAHGVAAIVMDIRFETHRSPADDETLADAIGRSGNVALAQHIDRLTVPGVDVEIEQIHSPIDLLQKKAISLAPFPLPEGALTHSFWAFFPTASGEVPTLPAVGLQIRALPLMDRFVRLVERAGIKDLDLPSPVRSVEDSRRLMEVLRRTLRSNPQVASRALTLLDGDETDGLSASDRRTLAALLRLYAGSRTYYLNFYGPAGSIETIPFNELLDERPGKRFALAGRTVFVGEGASQFVTSAEQPDTFRTIYSTREGFDLSGSEIGATALANLLTGRVLQPTSALRSSIILLGLGILLGILTRILPGIYAVPIVAAVAALYYGTTQFLFSRHALLIPLVIPVLFQLPLALFAGIFARYRDLTKLIRVEIDPNAPMVQSQGVCLHTDIEGYTQLSETSELRAFSSELREYYGMLRDTVEHRGGVLLGRAGDSTISLWRPTWPGRLLGSGRERTSRLDRKLRLKACLAAIEMREAVDRFNARHQSTRQFPTRFGLDASTIMFGPISGEPQAVGTPASTAARIQELNKDLGTKILASESVVHDQNGLVLRRLGSFRLAGRSEAVPVVEVMGERGKVRDLRAELRETFAAAVELYSQENYRDAAKLFRQFELETGQADGPTAYYLNKCQHKLRPTPTVSDSPSVQVDTQ
jgi:adenylate cyclase